MLKNMTIGWVGLGNMGRPMALRLHRAGAQVFFTSRNRATVDEMVSHGLRGTRNPRETARNADVVILTVFDAASVRDVLQGEEGVLAGLRPGSLMVDMGTTDVAATREFADLAAVRDVGYLDAPVSGGALGAAEGTLTIMVGGEAAHLERAMPIFSVLGKRVTHVGPVGAGQATKAANQVIVGVTIAAVAEAFGLALRAGVDVAKASEALQGGFADSRVLREHGSRMIRADFAPGASIAVQRKDMRQALALAKSFGLEMPVTTLAATRFDEVAKLGFDHLDQSSIFKLLKLC
jgi:3-hydroxyisobutyrate dehydrogenase-like beta-hydroxyacid dehydrogenase